MTTDETQVQARTDPRMQPLPPRHPGETALERHVRHIHHWVTFWSILNVVVLVAAIITGIVVLVHLHDVSVQNSYNPALNCQSLGGSDPSC